MINLSATIQTPAPSLLHSTLLSTPHLFKGISVRNVTDKPFDITTKNPFHLPVFVAIHHDSTGPAFRHELRKLKKLDKKRELCKSGLQNELQQAKIIRRAEKSDVHPEKIEQQLNVLKKKHIKIKITCEKAYDITMSDKNFKHVTAFRRQIIADTRNIELREKQEKVITERNKVIITLNKKINEIRISGINNRVRRFNNIPDNIAGENIIRNLHNDNVLCTNNVSLAQEFIKKAPSSFRGSFHMVINYCEKLRIINESLLKLHQEV
ncbi:hypothetical protein SC171_21765 [Pantoea cypripedii]|uniref:hypothetical protein n=1 Tax=Pantoea cypripedii TaxID=55209 RepID=UPI002FCC6749